ncbi:MAG: undecaprenyl/decaprenyl-phosphate alpha-N-acetylglucosaminyl 1-phosphate transferase [Chitinophagaceae bacterium]|nr:undecaprenyl/decaprenyl-phosphate alpha-N-acetylglucosaminyl 1-phosphate transferase [Chitinophagaceae bacterium]
MSQIIIEAAIVGMCALVIAMMLIPLIVKYSEKLGLMDKPNHRKVHAKPIPVIGGISIVISSGLSLLLSKTALQLLVQFPVLLSGSVLLFIIGVWDDRKNVRPIYRLALQLLCASAIAASGIRLTSMYGLFGMDELTIFWQYAITILIITGVTNAFNLMDGIDGLAGGIAFINLLILAALSWMLNQYEVFILLVAISGALVAFLKNNIHPARIFMGDGGSLMLGFLMSSIGILLIESGKSSTVIDISYVVLIVSTILVIPVFDSLRVYAGRIKRGESPFKADKTHLHHLFLILGLNHKRAAFFIYGLEIVILTLGFVLHQFVTISLSIVVIVALFLFVCQLLLLNSGVEKWTKIIRKMENS